MSHDDDALRSASALRAAFDRSFAEPEAEPPARTDGFLAIVVGEGRYLLAVAELAGVVVDRPIAALPGAAARMLGVAGIRGEVVPVYDLAALLGHRSQAAPRWLAITRTRERVGLAFERLAGHVSLPSTPTPPDRGSQPLLRGAVAIAGAPHTIVDLPAVVDVIDRAVRGLQPNQEA